MNELLIDILTLGIKPLYTKNLSFYKLIDDFRRKLPRQQEVVKKLTLNEVERKFPLLESAKHFNVVEVSTNKVNLTEVDLDVFYNNIYYFDYSLVFFKKYYQNYSKNLNRLKPKVENENLDIIVLQDILMNTKEHPLKPIPVLFYHLKWEWRFTSKIYLWLKKTKSKISKRLL